MALVRDEEALVDSYDYIEIDDYDLHREIEDVEACFVLVRSWVGPWPFPTCVVGACAERGTCAEEECSQEQYCYLVPEPAFAKFFYTSLARYDEAADNEYERQKRYEGVKGLAVELDVVIDAFCIQVACIGLLDDGGDESD